MEYGEYFYAVTFLRFTAYSIKADLLCFRIYPGFLQNPHVKNQPFNGRDDQWTER